MAELTVKLPHMDEIAIIRYLLDEIEEERQYNEMYYRQEKEALKEAKEKGGRYWEYMGSEFAHEPRKSVINDDRKMILRLLLKIREV